MPLTLPDDPKMDMDDDRALQAVGEFFLNGDVRDENCRELAQAILRWAIAHREDAAPTIFLHLQTSGGGIGAGMTLGAMLQRVKREYGVKVVTVVTGYAFSMGTVLLQYGDVRRMSAHAQLMLHDIQYGHGFGDTGMHADRQHSTDIYRGVVASIFAARNTRAKNDPSWWMTNVLTRAETYLASGEALSWGLVDEVTSDYPFPPPPA